MNSLIVVNPKAREGGKRRPWPEMEREILDALGPGRHEVIQTTQGDWGTGITRRALRDGIKRVVSVGGDGTLSAVVQGFFDPEDHWQPIASDAVLHVMPGGRGNDFFKMIAGAPSRLNVNAFEESWAKGLEVLRHGRPTPADIGALDALGAEGELLERRVLMNIGSFGWPALVVEKVITRAGKIGKSFLGKSGWAYVAQSAAAFRDYAPIRTRIEIDGRTVFDGPLFQFLVLNGKYNGGGLHWHKDARIDDGNFHFLAFENRGLLKTLLTSPSLVTGDWEGVAGVRAYSGRKTEIIVTQPGKLPHSFYEIDGDIPNERARGSVIDRVRVEVMPRAILISR